MLPQVGRIWNWNEGRQTWLASCTGTVVARGIVLTAAHCLYDLKAGAYYRKMAFIPAQASNDIASDDPGDVKAPYGTWATTSWWVPDTYRDGTNGPDWGSDLHRPAGRAAGSATSSARGRSAPASP